MVWNSLSHSPLKNGMSSKPRAEASSINWATSAEARATGLSTTTFLPASRIWRATCKWGPLGGAPAAAAGGARGGVGAPPPAPRGRHRRGGGGEGGRGEAAPRHAETHQTH